MASSLLTKILLSPRTIHTSSLFTHHPPILSSFFNVVDASWYMPDEQRNPIQEYQVSHILGALFFDIDGIAYRTTNLPHMLPSEAAFAAAVSALGIQNKDGLVVYDGKGLFSAARVWWMFRVFGHDRVWVLDGGLPRWRASGYDVESSASSDAILKASAASEAIDKVGPITFETKFQPRLVWTLEQVGLIISVSSYVNFECILSFDRFDGIAVEPRKGIRSGHVPGSRCIPFPQILDISQALLPADELKKRFEQEGSNIFQYILILPKSFSSRIPLSPILIILQASLWKSRS
ncbi:hypothetical protein RYX36_023313 [Vicia faba]